MNNKISYNSVNVEESISTLKFADRAKQVMTQIVLNETRPVDHEMVMKLQRYFLLSYQNKIINFLILEK